MVVTMPKIEKNYIKSNTKWLQLIASRDQTLIRKDTSDEVWNLTIYIHGCSLEFTASGEDFVNLFTKEEALQRVEEFEEMMEAENKDYFHDTLEHLLALVQRKTDTTLAGV